MSATKSQLKVCRFFNDLNSICVIVGAYCKRLDEFRESQAKEIVEAISAGEVETGRGLNQISSLRDPEKR